MRSLPIIYMRCKPFLKSFIPKIAGLAILALQGIQARGQLPHTREDWTMLLLGVGLTFASNNTPKLNNNGENITTDLH